jgi:hypothetical protein
MQLYISMCGIKLFAADLCNIEAISPGNRHLPSGSLRELRLKLLDDKKAILIEKVKNAVIEMVHYFVEFPLQNHSL